MTIREIIRNLEEERNFFKKENEDLKLEIRKLNVEKRHIQFELDSLKKGMCKKENENLKLEIIKLNEEKRHIQSELDSLKKEMCKKDEHIETPNIEEQKPKRIRKKKNIESIE